MCVLLKMTLLLSTEPINQLIIIPFLGTPQNYVNIEALLQSIILCSESDNNRSLFFSMMST